MITHLVQPPAGAGPYGNPARARPHSTGGREIDRPGDNAFEPHALCERVVEGEVLGRCRAETAREFPVDWPRMQHTQRVNDASGNGSIARAALAVYLSNAGGEFRPGASVGINFYA